MINGYDIARRTKTPVFCSISFKSIYVKRSESLKFSNRLLMIYLALPHFISNNVTNRPTFSSSKVIEPVHSPGIWELGCRFLVASCKTRYPITISTRLFASLTNFCVGGTERKSSTNVFHVAAITWQLESQKYSIGMEG